MDAKLILQIVGIVLGLLYLWLEYRADIRLWIVGLIMPVIHGALYFKSGLYADCTLQLYYIFAGLYGLSEWHRRKAATNQKPATEIAHISEYFATALFSAYVLAHGIIYLILVEFTDSTVPFWDSLTTALSLIAMWMLSQKVVEQWLVWFVVDVITVGLYIYKGIPITAALYALYSILAIAGYMRWRKIARENK